MLCDSCADHQEYLLESGDGSQVICEHQLKIDEETGASTSELLSSLFTSDVDRSSTTVTATGADTASRKRKFVTADRFAKLADVKLRRKIAPVKKWRELRDRISHRWKSPSPKEKGEKRSCLTMQNWKTKKER